MPETDNRPDERPDGPVSGTIDPEEIARFSALAAEWWDPEGKFKPLHRLNPLRLTYIRDHLCARFDRNPKSLRSLEGLYRYATGLTPPLTYGTNRHVGAAGAHVVSVDLDKGSFAASSTWVQP